MDLNKTGKYLKKLREENNLTQKDVAYQLNISVQAVSKWETGKSFPDVGLLERISKLYNVKVEYLLNGKLTETIGYYNKKTKMKSILIITLVIVFSIFTLFFLTTFNIFKIYELNSALDFFEKEFHSLDSRTSAILKSEITRITNIFVSDYNISQTFCAPLDELNFKGFSSMLNCGKIVILNMNIAEYKNLSKLISAYLKLDFQSEVMYNLSKNKAKPCAFICDEYAEYVDFYNTFGT